MSGIDPKPTLRGWHDRKNCDVMVPGEGIEECLANIRGETSWLMDENTGPSTDGPS